MKKIDADVLEGKAVQFAAIRPYDLLDAIEYTPNHVLFSCKGHSSNYFFNCDCWILVMYVYFIPYVLWIFESNVTQNVWPIG